MFDDLLDVVFHNWSVPLFSFFDDIFQGPSTQFSLSNVAGVSKREMRRVLSKAGVYCWGDVQSNDGFYVHINVRKADERKAYRALKAADMPVISPKLED